MKNLKAFLFILSIAVIASCSPKEESPELIKDTKATGGTGGGGTGGGGTGGGGGGTGGGGTGGGPVTSQILTANYFGSVGGSHTSSYFNCYDSLGEFVIQGGNSTTFLSFNFPRQTKTGSYQLKGPNSFFIANIDSFQTSPKFFYTLMPTEQHAVNIAQIDTIDHTIKGTFSFRTLNANGDTAKITTGNFHVNYRKN